MSVYDLGNGLRLVDLTKVLDPATESRRDVYKRQGDYSAVDLDQIYLLMDLDLGDREPDEDILIVASVTEI